MLGRAGGLTVLQANGDRYSVLQGDKLRFGNVDTVISYSTVHAQVCADQSALLACAYIPATRRNTSLAASLSQAAATAVWQHWPYILQASSCAAFKCILLKSSHVCRQHNADAHYPCRTLQLGMLSCLLHKMPICKQQNLKVLLTAPQHQRWQVQIHPQPMCQTQTTT